MPPFVRMTKEELASEFAKFMKKRKFLKSDEHHLFFEKYGMYPRPNVALEILRNAFSKITFIESHIGFFPECMDPAFLKGYCYFDLDSKRAYFSDLTDLVLFKLLCDTEASKIVQ